MLVRLILIFFVNECKSSPWLNTGIGIKFIIIVALVSETI